MSVLDWSALRAQGDERLRFIRQLEGFYVYAHSAASTATRAHHYLLSGHYRDDPRFLGYCSLGAPSGFPWLADARWPGEGEYRPFAEVLQQQMRSGGRIGMLTFCATPRSNCCCAGSRPGRSTSWPIWRSVTVPWSTCRWPRSAS